MKKEPDTPQGTIVLIGVFAVLLAAMWFNAYFHVLSQGAN